MGRVLKVFNVLMLLVEYIKLVCISKIFELRCFWIVLVNKVKFEVFSYGKRERMLFENRLEYKCL